MWNGSHKLPAWSTPTARGALPWLAQSDAAVGSRARPTLPTSCEAFVFSPAPRPAIVVLGAKTKPFFCLQLEKSKLDYEASGLRLAMVTDDWAIDQGFGIVSLGRF